MGKIRLLVIEDNRLLRDSISTMLSKMTETTVVALLESCEQLRGETRRYAPDVVLLEPAQGSRDGAQQVGSVMRQFPKTKVIVMGLVAELTDVFGFVRAGATGFLLKDSTPQNFRNAIRAVVGGATALPSMLTAPLFAQVVTDASGGTGPNEARLSNSVIFTKREREVIVLVAAALTNKEIAAKLHLSTSTIKSHIHTILKKLTLHTRIHIAQYARSHTGFDAATDPIPPDGE